MCSFHTTFQTLYHKWDQEKRVLKNLRQTNQGQRQELENAIQQSKHTNPGHESHQERVEMFLNLKSMEETLNRLKTQSAEHEEQSTNVDIVLFGDMAKALKSTQLDPRYRDQWRPILASLNATAEESATRGESYTSSDSLTNLETNPDLIARERLKTSAASNRKLDPRSNSVPGNSAARIETREEHDTSSTQARACTRRSISTPVEDPAQETNHVPEASSTQQAEPNPDSYQSMRNTFVSHTNPDSEATSTEKAYLHSETYPASGERAAHDDAARPEAISQGLATADRAVDSLNQHADSLIDDSSIEKSNDGSRRERKQRIVTLRLSKRPGGAGLGPQPKRLRRDSNERTITFDEVFENGEAAVKYTIAQYPRQYGNWYIFKCDEHDKHFERDPIRGAACHVSRYHTRSGTKAHDVAVKILGIHVLDCDSEKAKRNNEIARKAFAKGQGLPRGRRDTELQNEQRPDKGLHSDKPSKHYGKQTRLQERSGVFEPQDQDTLIPVAGKIYATRYLSKGKWDWFPAFVLPWESFKIFDWGEPLMEQLPSCYLPSQCEGENPRWAPGYQDGGDFVTLRHYPVMFFENRKFPENSRVSWVPVEHFQKFDAENPNILYRNAVAKFIDTGDRRLGPKKSEKNYIVISDESDNDPPDVGSHANPEEPRERYAPDESTRNDNDKDTASDEKCKDNSGNIREDFPGNGHQAQTEPNSDVRMRSCANDTAISHDREHCARDNRDSRFDGPDRLNSSHGTSDYGFSWYPRHEQPQSGFVGVHQLQYPFVTLPRQPSCPQSRAYPTDYLPVMDTMDTVRQQEVGSHLYPLAGSRSALQRFDEWVPTQSRWEDLRELADGTRAVMSEEREAANDSELALSRSVPTYAGEPQMQPSRVGAEPRMMSLKEILQG
ncbi:hypothetical protein FALBO_5268 [Fusarium albosuccineum]|uniref:Uncharacterized protein n=1 Tax=Fusarium albosuccineum TaxID=1237068 RepID=A0A8H4PEF0_9HYPO|nr:hypothetical protein FALBO_5268 [Fusarium albosuccineum]